MEQPLNITALNDFIFCPISIYFHNLYGTMDKTLYQDKVQLDGTKAHESIDTKSYTGKSSIITGMDVYCEEFDLAGKIDMYDTETFTLTERKNKVTAIYDGYVYQIYAQCLALREMGYEVKKLVIHSIEDNRNYPISLPEDDSVMYAKFIKTNREIREFDFNSYVQTNHEKCAHCIYAPYCDREV